MHGTMESVQPLTAALITCQNCYGDYRKAACRSGLGEQERAGWPCSSAKANMKSAEENPEVVDEYLTKEV